MQDGAFERFQRMAKDEFGASVVKKTGWNKEEVWDAIHELSDIRGGYNLFDDKEWSSYHACSLAIKALREVVGDPIDE